MESPLFLLRCRVRCREHVLFVKTLMTVKTNATPRPIVGSDHLRGLSGLNGHNCRFLKKVDCLVLNKVIKLDSG